MQEVRQSVEERDRKHQEEIEKVREKERVAREAMVGAMQEKYEHQIREIKQQMDTLNGEEQKRDR